jgi:D-alanyl-D-alanine dipeptidase
MLYGYASAQAGLRFSMPYLALDSTDECIDDPSSMYYNMIVDRSNVRTVDWKSSERMRFQGKYYEWGVVVDNNMDPRLAAGGSCIFLHVWGGSDSPTSGCTSLDRDRLLKIMTWLDPVNHPVLVQLPQAAYDQLAGSWELP